MLSNDSRDGWEYMIGSTHYLSKDGEIFNIDLGTEEIKHVIAERFGGDGLALAKCYYEHLASLPKYGNFDIIGHFDLVTKNNEKGKFIDVTSEKYLRSGFEAIHALKGKIPFFEVNTGAISRRYRNSPYPQMEFLREFNRLGFGVVISSDCHDKKHIDCFYDEAEALISAAGFRSKWILTENGFKEVGL
jgi:histidinol-phosphatase (PHP family)